MANQLCMRCFISGKVQGVWYRANTKKQAEQLGLKGWARNLADGRVEVFACGDLEQLEILFQWLQEGPELANVEDCTREDFPWEEYERFAIF
ncbi:MAG: acylphosphatase [Legionella sp.]|uniref:acylphosphatase n=1 Tax=Legionella sp. TaxID=459 RepID=UPI0039E2AF30